MSKTSNTRAKRRNPPPPAHVRVSEAAAATQTARSTVYKWIRDGSLNAVRHDGLLYVQVENVKAARRTNKRSTRTIPLPPNDMVTTRHAANVTGAHQVSIQEWARAGKIRAERHGAKKWMWYVNLADVEHMARTSKPGRQQGP